MRTIDRVVNAVNRLGSLKMSKQILALILTLVVISGGILLFFISYNVLVYMGNYRIFTPFIVILYLFILKSLIPKD